MQTDPVENSDDRNLYAYVLSDPANYTDPDGRDPERAFGFGFGLVHSPEQNALQARAEASVGNFSAVEGIALGEAVSSGIADYEAGTPTAAVVGAVVRKVVEGGVGGKKGKGSGTTTPDKGKSKGPGLRDPTSNTQKPQRAQRELGDAQKRSRTSRPETQGPGAGEHEGARRPKANDIETKKTDDRAQHDLERNWKDYVDPDKDEIDR